MKIIVKIMLLFSWLCLMYVNVKSQVTIGFYGEPVKGALLDLKDQISSSDTITSKTGGLVLSRVKLVSRTTLQPFINLSDSEWQPTNRKQTCINHIGLVVFNLTKDSVFHHGIYVWAGENWEPLSSEYNAIHLPAFKLEWKSGAKINLYDVYTKNFKPTAMNNYVSSRSGTTPVAFPNFVANAADFYYVVSNYSVDLFTVHGVNAAGELTYSAKGNSPVLPANAFINVILIRK